MKHRLIAALMLALLALPALGCGRKLPPLPPGQGDPVEISSLEFRKDGTVEARGKVYIPGGRVTLLGKPKGLCPVCTDDLTKRDEAMAPEEGAVILRDRAPESDFMVYRLAFEKGTTSFLTNPRVVRK
ncbi:MAG TPA: hypothetical protein PKM41_09300 [Deltaproteobacteria bacterium]|jgi:hypothetical protein|nr:hypothetical protein [Deltaproteobacteria bacterium]HOI06288.1 hypothetical protein [Deltaproteobacteria bacterium]